MTLEESLDARDKSHIRLSYVTHFYFNQADGSAILALLSRYAQYDAALLDVIQFVVVDDGSPLQFEIPDLGLNIIWLRINEDIRWNQAGARNLGVTYAKSDKILITDVDHEFPEHTLRKMVETRDCNARFYKIRKRDMQTGRIGKGHSNTFFMSRAHFFRLYGYDEEFSGHYGAEDYRFVKFRKYHGAWQRYLPKRYWCFHRQDIERSRSYHSLERDLSYNTPIDASKKRQIEEWGKEQGHSRIFLNFTWKIVKENARSNRIARKSARWWKPLWIPRTLRGGVR